MTEFLLPTPTYTIGGSLITVQYDAEAAAWLTGLLNASGEFWNFEGDNDDKNVGESYIATLITQLLTEIEMTQYIHTFLDPEKFIPTSGGRLYRQTGGASASPYQTVAWQASAPINGQKWYYDIWLPANAYALEVNVVTSNNSGKFDFYIEGEGHLSYDFYSAAATPHNRYGGPIGTLAEGSHRLWIENMGKNASAVDYYLLIENIELKSLHT